MSAFLSAASPAAEGCLATMPHTTSVVLPGEVAFARNVPLHRTKFRHG
jgi:hypothetical protein